MPKGLSLEGVLSTAMMMRDEEVERSKRKEKERGCRSVEKTEATMSKKELGQKRAEKIDSFSLMAKKLLI